MLDVARAVGKRLRAEGGRFVVFPTLLGADGNPPVSASTDRTTSEQLLDALRQGAHTRFADTLAYLDDQRRAALPDSSRRYPTLAALPAIHGDSASVDVLGGLVLPSYGPIERQLFRYWFRRVASRWVFVRRELLYAT